MGCTPGPALCVSPSVAASQGQDALRKVTEFFPEDSNSLQISWLWGCATHWLWGARLGVGERVGSAKPCRLLSLTAQLHSFPVPAAEADRLKVTFEEATDFFGRVVVYHLRVLGEKVA